MLLAGTANGHRKHADDHRRSRHQHGADSGTACVKSSAERAPALDRIGRHQEPALIGLEDWRTSVARQVCIFQEVEDKIREVIPERDRDLIVDDIGVPQRSYNLAFTDGSTINVNDGVILVQ